MTKEQAIEKAQKGRAMEHKGAEDSGVIFDMPWGGGGGTCELACHFYHTQEISSRRFEVSKFSPR